MTFDTEAIRRLAEEYDGDNLAWLGDSGDDDAWDDDATEASPVRRFGRAANFRSSPSVGAARVGAAAPAGGAMSVRFPQPVASAQAIERLKQDTQKAIADVRADVARMKADTDRKLKEATDRIGAMQQGSMMMTLLPLLQPAPKITSITLPGEGGSVKPNVALTPTAVQYERPDMMMMLLPMMLSGGMGGGAAAGGTPGASGQNDMMLLAVALMASRRS
ncbi:hypothetical protein ACFOD4_20510 [Pseudoroseomonas globiformis]|uniref:Uncharacterized protein n=1 Tax=Teichococcus globiformis TaxID=2307229 RepID=A0ABV7G409_9PROT